MRSAQPSTAPLKEDPEALVLRGRPRPAVRFRRGLIIGVTGAVAAALAALSWLALEPPARPSAAPVASNEPARSADPEALAGVPAGYGDVPRLGPPLPGDLGRPILEQQHSLEQQPSFDSSDAEHARAAADSERQRLESERRAALSSPVLVRLVGGRSASDDRAASLTKDAASAASELQAAPSPYTLSAGTVIPASLITGLNSDLQGPVLAQVTENVRDSATGRTILIPQGARLIGRYDDKVAYGQKRALLVWSRIVFPDGSSVELDAMPATDVSGHAGLEDEVDSHTWQLLKGVALSTILGVGTQLSLGSSQDDLVRAIRESTQQNAADAGDKLVSRNLDVRPTIRIRPGWPVRVIVGKDLILKPWRG